MNRSHYSAQERRFLKTLFKVDIYKKEILKTLWISVNAQKRIKTKTPQQQQQNIPHISRQIQR